MLIIEKKENFFKNLEVWFSDGPFDIKGYDLVNFRACNLECITHNFEISNQTTLIIDLTQELDTIWNKMSKKDCRRAIQHGIKEGIKIKINQNYEAFCELDNTFRHKKGISPNRFDIDIMKNFGTLFIAELDNKLLSGIYYIHDDVNFRSRYRASDRFDSNKEYVRLVSNSNRLLIWEAIKHAKQHKIKYFDMGGYYIGNEPDQQKEKINTFKKSFGGDITTKYDYLKIYSNKYKIGRFLYHQLSVRGQI